MDLATFRTNKSLENEGAWTHLAGNARVKLARIGNRRYRELLQTKLKPHRRAIRAGTMPEEVTEALMTEVVVETVLLDWENVELNGEAVPFSRPAALDILSDPEMKDLRDMIVELAGDMELYRAKDLEEAEKNSGTSSRGKSSGAKSSTSSPPSPS